MNFTTIKVPGKYALQNLELYRSQFLTTGRYPFLIGHENELESIKREIDDRDREAADVLRFSRDLTIAEWMAERRARAEKYEFFPEKLLGSWPSEDREKSPIEPQGILSSSLHIDSPLLGGKVKREVYLGFADIEWPWQLPAILHYGNWNSCPKPEIHCMCHREWHKRWGAEITGISGDVIECTVKNPPTDRKSAMDLAWEQYWYCADIVEQGCDTISNLAATLLNSNSWYFWWD